MGRWENYFMKSDSAFTEFWESYQEEANPTILYIMGMGFDPRTNLGVQEIFSFPNESKRDTWMLRYFNTEEEVYDIPLQPVQDHITQLNDFLLAKNLSTPIQKNVILRTDDNVSKASVNASSLINAIEDIASYTDIIIDISAMPRSVFIPLINKCLDLIEQYNLQKPIVIKNLHVIVCENAKLDAMISDNGIDEKASYLYGLAIKEVDRTSEHKKVWIPILGEHQIGQFDRIKEDVNAAEVCPVLPFPCENLRRGDNLLIDYQDRLLNDPDFEIKNIVYADEANPFQVYRLLNKIIQRYDKSFSLLSGSKIIVSALSSKLLSVGAFMAVYEKRKEGKNVGIMHVESMGSRLDTNYADQKIEVAKHNKLFEIWLAGSPYHD